MVEGGSTFANLKIVSIIIIHLKTKSLLFKKSWWSEKLSLAAAAHLFSSEGASSQQISMSRANK